MSKITITYNNVDIVTATGQTSPVAVTYNGSQITTVSDGETKTLICSNKYMSGDIVCAGKTLTCSGKIMSSDVSIKGESEYRTITVTSSDTSKGTVSGTTTFQYLPSSSSQTVSITTTCTAKTGYKYSNFTASVGSFSGTTLTIPANTNTNISVYANFTAQTYTISKGSYVSGGSTSYTYSTSAQTVSGFSYSSRTGMTFQSFTVNNGCSITTAGVLTIPAGTTGTITITANYTANTYTISKGSYVSGGSTSYTYSSSSQTVTGFTASSRSGYNFTGFSATNGCSITSAGTLTIPAGTTGTITVTANYEAISWSYSTVKTSTTSSNYSGTLSVSNCFRVKLTLSSASTVTFYSSSSLDTYGYISTSTSYNSSTGVPTSYIYSDDDSGSGNNFSITTEELSAGTYYLWARGYSATVSGSCTIYWTVTQSQTFTDLIVPDTWGSVMSSVTLPSVETGGVGISVFKSSNQTAKITFPSNGSYSYSAIECNPYYNGDNGVFLASGTASASSTKTIGTSSSASAYGIIMVIYSRN